ncbi:MAG: hypothetical protein F4045_04200 [Chloroflexi bacterium]|nr:hypothetical protein [Chloroflexota bacterium]MYK34317.1 hypothetical protein [Chloroflexota bacterium]
MRTRAQPAAEPLSGAARRPFSIVVVDMDAGLRMMGTVEVVPGACLLECASPSSSLPYLEQHASRCLRNPPTKEQTYN